MPILATDENLEKLTVEEQALRYAQCRLSIFEYAKYAKIRNETTGAIEPFMMWPHAKLLLYYLLVYKLVDLVKGKQEGASWTAALLHGWIGLRDYTRVLCLSKGRDEAKELLDKTRFINNNLPSWLRQEYEHDGTEYIKFKNTQSNILALSSTKDAGVGYTATHVTSDEVEFHDFARENYGHIKPTVDAGASHLQMSTASPDAQSHFKTHVMRALRGENNYKVLFWPYYVRPGRDAEWYIRTRRDYWPRWLFLKDYPRDLKDALGSIEGQGLFDAASIDRLVKNTREPLEIMSGSTYIFHRPDPTVTYYAGGDAAEGQGGDNGVIWIEGRKGFVRALCAIMCTNELTPDLFASHALQLLNYYYRPLLVMGSDAWGKMVLGFLANLGYRDRIYCSDDKGDTLGLSEEANKQQRLMNFSFAVRDGLSIPFRLAIDEMSGWVMKDGKYVSTFATDDCIIAGANANIAREMTPSNEEVTVDHFY